MPFFVNAPPTTAKLVPEGTGSQVMGPGYVVAAADQAEALRIVKAFRAGSAWTIGLDVHVVQ